MSASSSSSGSSGGAGRGRASSSEAPFDESHKRKIELDNDVDESTGSTLEQIQALAKPLYQFRPEEVANMKRLQDNTRKLSLLVENLNSKTNLVLETLRLESGPDGGRALDAAPLALMNGWMSKGAPNKNKWKKRYFVLKGGTLNFYDNESQSGSKSIISLDGATIEKDKTERQCLSITESNGTITYLAADTKRENSTWFSAINCMQQQAEYNKQMRIQEKTPDGRIVEFFNNPMRYTLHLDDSPSSYEAIVAITSTIRYHSVLHILSIERAMVTDIQLEILAKAIAKNKSLGVLKLGSNAFGPDGGNFLAQMLEQNDTLVELYVEKNGIGDAGVAALSRALMSHPSLSHLALDATGLTDEGMGHFAKTLSSGHRMPMLSLTGNDIGDAGASALASALQSNRTVKQLLLGNNKISNTGMEALLRVLPSTQVERVCTLGNKITSSIAPLVLGTLLQCKLVSYIEVLPELTLSNEAFQWVHVLGDVGLLQPHA